jgi:hypothetical protein
MAFIIILAWIGIATILRLREYRTGKTFFYLILIALLINFSPVLVGLIVDFSNIIINFFVSGILRADSFNQLLVGDPGVEGDGIIEAASIQVWRQVGEAVRFWGPLENQIVGLGVILAYGFFFAIAAFIFFLLALLYIFRVLAFWVLLILAPLAFLCFILPGTRKYFRRWWHQLLQWAIIGIVAAFFVWLAFGFLSASTTRPDLYQFFGSVEDCDPTTETIEADCNPDPGICRPCDTPLVVSLQQTTNAGEGAFAQLFILLMNALLPLGVATVFLLLGLFSSFITGAMGASMIIDFARRKGKAAPKVVRRKGGEVLRKMAPEKMWRKLEEWRTAPTLKERWREAETKRERALALATAPLATFQRWAGRRGLAARVAHLKDIEREEEKLRKAKVPEELYEAVRKRDILHRLAAFRVAREKGWIGELKLSKEEITSLGKEAGKIHHNLVKDIIKGVPWYFEEIRKALPEEIREKAGLALSKEPEKRERELRAHFSEEELRMFEEEELPEEIIERRYLARKITKGLSPSDIERLDLPEFLETLREAKEKEERGEVPTGTEEIALRIEDAMHRFWSGREIGAAARKFGLEFVDVFMEEAERRGADWYDLVNKKVLNYLRSTPAGELGFREIPGKTLKEEEIPPEKPKIEKPKIEIAPEEAPRRIRKKILTEREKEELKGELEALRRQLSELEKKPPEALIEKEIKRMEELAKRIEEIERELRES